MPLRTDEAVTYNGAGDYELADDNGDHSLPNVEAQPQKAGSGSPTTDIEARQKPEADEGPGSPGAAIWREWDDVMVDPRCRLAFVLACALHLEVSEPYLELWPSHGLRRDGGGPVSVGRHC